jgi:hypothetical protein
MFWLGECLKTWSAQFGRRTEDPITLCENTDLFDNIVPLLAAYANFDSPLHLAARHNDTVQLMLDLERSPGSGCRHGGIWLLLRNDKTVDEGMQSQRQEELLWIVALQ